MRVVVVVLVILAASVAAEAKALVVMVEVVVRGTCRYEGDLPLADRPELIVRKADGEDTRER